MNISALITRIKIELGIYAIALPIEDVNGFLTDIITDISLRTFSNYCPTYDKFRFKLSQLKCLEKEADYETYILPDVFHSREILFIRDVTYDEGRASGIGYWGGGRPILQGNILNEAILSNASLPLINKIIPKLTFKYEHPRKVTIWNAFTSDELVFDIAFMHDKSLASISPTMEESFIQLVLLDVKNALYGILKHYPEINSAYGQISLKIDDWGQAESDRKQLIEEWNNLYHMDVQPFIYA